ncbi:hypothetical protein [Streptomyces sp. UNOC14_S4]|uniref:hypothetical protein n=1 Tax=Streptomyces sp. UNOC14_S4 TaxID=2872340 RepID=UPI001E4AFD3C|nr:hypothetical protein [Streptomyces sp. UNOC14_S4]MCC3772663.1 hypothetical protein [Streptomyces sp. UNOC14_S4]
MSVLPVVFRTPPLRASTGAVLAGAACAALLAAQPAQASGTDQGPLAHVPADIRGSCSSVASSILPPSASGAVSCKTTNGTSIVYMQYRDSSSMEQGYQSDLRAYSFDHDTCGASTPLNGKQPYSVNGQEAGTAACFRDKDGVSNDIEWTNTSLSILSLIKSSSSYDQLIQSWQSAGPVP